jgi:hypothetical protein
MPSYEMRKFGEVKIGGHEKGEGRKNETDDELTTPKREARMRGVEMKVERGVRGMMVAVVEDDKSLVPHHCCQ